MQTRFPDISSKRHDTRAKSPNKISDNLINQYVRKISLKPKTKQQRWRENLLVTIKPVRDTVRSALP